ncbi:cytochrome d ubiquinol oxidase subunit II [Streptomyces sp. CO7]
METLATALLAVFTVGHLVLAGADIGVGMLLPWLGRGQEERRTVLAAIGPFFLGNEVWLVAAAGLMAGAFPGLEHILLYEHRGAFVLLLVGWVVRDVGLWWRGRVDAAAWRTGCDALIVTGSVALALALGAVCSDVLTGTPLLAPLGAALFALHGGGFARLRLTGAPLRRAYGSYPLTAAALAGTALLTGARLDPGHALAGPESVRVVALFVAALLPFLLAAQAVTWWTFRHRVTGPGYL